MSDLSGFDATEFEPTANFEPIPAGDYSVVITDSERLPTKAGTGRYLKLTFQVIEGPHKGRVLWSRLNIDNPSTAAVEIAQRQLADICRAVGVPKPNDSVELHDLPLVVSVSRVTRKDNGDIVNEVKGYKGQTQPRPPASATTSSAPLGAP